MRYGPRTMTGFAGLSFVLAGALWAGPAAAPGANSPAPPDPLERRQFALLSAGTATGVVGLGGLVLGLIGVDRSSYAACEVTEDPTEPVLTPQTRCFEESVYPRKHRNANIMMAAGLAGGGALVLTSAALITSGLVIRRRRLRAARLSTLSPMVGRTWGLAATLRF